MEAEQPAGAEPARIRIAGAWSGVLEVDLASWTLPMLRAEVAARVPGGGGGGCINLICGGRVLKDGDGAAQSLEKLGLKSNAKVLASVVAPDRRKALNEEAAAHADQSQKLARLRDAAIALAGRHSDGSVPVEDFNIELEDQSGQKVKFGSEIDQKGLMVGLMLHANAKSLIKRKMYKAALDVLSMGEEAFTLCDPKVIEMIDNVPILQLDTVWCYFMLRDISCLSVAGERLAKARKGFERSHGKDSTRFRLLQAGRPAELAIYVRLELLEGVVAYHSGKFEESHKALNAAQAKYLQLQVPDEALSLLMGMGYKEHAAKRALRMTGQDIQSAVDFLVEQREKKLQRQKEDLQRRDEITEQKKYGRTPQNKAVDIQRLNELASIGFEKSLAAEALRLNENDMEKTLDLLTDPEKNCDLQRRLDARKKLKTMRPTPAEIEELVSMGYDRSAVMNAVDSSHTKDEALQVLERSDSRNNNEQADGTPQATRDEGGSSGTVAGDEDERDEAMVAGDEDERDEAMEDELAKELTGDPLADYDIEVTEEGEAITEYLTLLDSTSNAAKGAQ